MRVRPPQPCDKHCPNRTGECKLTCEKWARYEAEYKTYDREHREELEKEQQLCLYKARFIKKQR